ncbi:hypothetical protein B0T22DRAFT_131867 [Podospora appendiculata]|uniref:Uncharacterized protein n=1 Tax=Podospora appendiculata TaxID=314037 RepID=A0AAE1CBL3_9PEZI|nr:hypothetical protein B0T22DRAFT_131867 [Podospora appendiculata]
MSSIFTITAAPDSDIWRKPPHTDVFNAATATPPNTPSPTGPLQTFVSAKASFSFDWTEQYDQAGLLLSFRPQGGSSSSSSAPNKWIKTGVEFYNGQPMLSTVACDRWADWSVAPLTTFAAAAETWTTILIEKEVNENETNERGSSLWVYQVLDSGERVALREICWVYGDDDIQWELEVLAMAARPAKKATTGLEVRVRDMEVEWS